MQNISRSLLWAITAMLAGPALAENVDTFRCGGHIIEVGNTKAEVQEHCGEPSFQSMDQWTYDRGSNEFTVTVHFGADGVVNRITMTNPNL